MQLRKAKPTRKPNYKLIPCNQTDSIEEFNNILAIYRERDNEEPYTRITRTPSGGISIKNYRGHQLDLKSNSWGCELTVLDYDGYFRLQYRNNIAKDLGVENKDINGFHALEKFGMELKKIGIKLEDYALNVEEAIEYKTKIESPMILCPQPLFMNREINGPVYHLDRRSSYPAGLKEYRPEFAPVIDSWFQKKEEGQKEYKGYLNLLIGMMQSLKYNKGKYADMAEYAIRRNNEELKKMAKELSDNGDVVLLYNTDGIWFKGDYIPKTGNGLGDFRLDYIASKFRIKSHGAYEFIGYDPNKENIEDSKYYPKIRGKTKLDYIKPREEWTWGDIYNREAEPIKFICTWENGIVPVEEEVQ